MSLLDKIQMGLTGLGMIPGIGEVANAASGLVSVTQGDWEGAALSAAAMVPIAGEAADVAKEARLADKLLQEGNQVAHAVQGGEKAVHTIQAGEQSAQVVAEGEQYLGNAAKNSPNIHEGKQGKHIVGHNNFKSGRSELHVDPNELLPHVGTGTPANSVRPGQPGYRERVDFGREIGHHVEEGTGVKTPTSVGIIHHAKDGVHIVPARP